MKYSDKNEEFFKSLASLYAEKDGERLKNEFEEIERENKTPYSARLDKKTDNKIRWFNIKRITYVATPVAACFLLIALYFGRIPSVDKIDNSSPAAAENTPPAAVAPDNSMAAAPPAPQPDNTDRDIALLSAKLPQGYDVTGIDYDKEKTIYYIANETDNQIVLTAEKSAAGIDKTGYQEISINGTRVYGLVKNDFSVITYEKDNMLYTLTSRYNYKDLIDISKNLI